MASMMTYREGGWGWVVVMSCFMIEFIVYGSLKAFGVFLTPMKEEFGTDLWIFGSIVALHYGVQFVLTPVAATVVGQVGTRPVAIFGGVLYGLGLLLATVTDSVAILAVALIVLAGSGAACTVETANAELVFYFKEKYQLAVYISLMGAPVGMMVCGPVAQLLQDIYGWRGAMLLLGGFGFHMIVCGMLLRKPTGLQTDILTHSSLDDDADGNHGNIEQVPTNQIWKMWNSLVSVLSLYVFLSVDFMIVAGIQMLYSISYGGVVVYMVSNGLSLGLSAIEASSLTSAFGVGNLFGLSLTALILHKKILSIYAIAVLAVCMAATCLALEPFIPSYIGQLVIVFLIGVGIDIATAVGYVLTRSLPFGDNKFVIVLGWQTFLCGIASSVGDTFAGWLYEVTGTFYATFSLISASMGAVVLLLLLHAFRTKGRSSSKQHGITTSLFQTRLTTYSLVPQEMSAQNH